MSPETRSETAAQAHDETALARFSTCLVWALPLLAAHLYIKYVILEFGGLDVAKRALSLTEVPATTYLTFYARDVLESLVLVPLALFALVTLLPRGARGSARFVTVQVGLILAASCWGSYMVLGRYPGPELVLDFIRAYQVDRSTVDPLSIFPPRQLAKIAVILLLAVGLFVASRFAWVRQLGARLRTPLLVAYGAVVLIAAGLALTSSATSYHRGHLARVADAAIAQDGLRFEDGSQLSRSDLYARHRQVVFPDGLAPAASDADVPAPSRAPNVVVVVLETASARDYAFTPQDMPAVSQLLDHAIVARNHLSTYPYSVRANFSLFTSVYDLDTKEMMADALMDADPRPMDALPRVLADRGYDTRYYYPVELNHQNEQWMWPYLGFDQVISGAAFDAAVAESAAEGDARAVRDVAMIDRVVQDMATLGAEDTPFLFAVVFALGHAPYPDIRSEAAKATDPAPDRAALVGAIRGFLDGQIERLVEGLRAQGALEDTVFVITGDHGVRSLPDDPRLDLRVLNEASFHVPLLVHYPRGIESATAVDYTTSHVDVVPTILELAGIPREDFFLEGLPLTDARIADRVTFFLGGHYYGSNGLHYRGRYFMENEIAELAYVNGDFAFGGEALVTAEQPERAAEAERYRGWLQAFRRSQLAVASWLRDSDPAND